MGIPTPPVSDKPMRINGSTCQQILLTEPAAEWRFICLYSHYSYYDYFYSYLLSLLLLLLLLLLLFIIIIIIVIVIMIIMIIITNY